MNGRRVRSLSLGILALSSVSLADEPASTYNPRIAPASAEAERAIKRFRAPEGLKVELFAAEPMLANPVAFCVDERNRFYVAETFRLNAGVTDTRGHMNWLDDDMACRTVADRVAMYRKYLGAEFAKFGLEHDRVRLIEDRDGDGKADHSTVFADGFHDPAVGLGAGLLARKGDVFYTNVPDLWKLRDDDRDGRADVRTALHTGYGVHVGFIGHDLHGLRMGPDGRLYFSIGDRGLNVVAGKKKLFLPDTGAVLRCEPDGSDLEIYATGLRNPQELAFDELGNLFTVDNNSDSGDRARLVHIVEGGDSGWRIGYQFIEQPTSRGPWNAEKLWHPRPENQAAYMLPPLANFSDGPSGLTYDPGTGLPDRFRRHFFLADFRGSAAQSGVRSFTVKPDGASFALSEQKQFLWGLEATDVDFGTDGALYVSDWVEGWGLTGKGRIYKVFDPATKDDKASAETRRLLAEGMQARPDVELARLLGHADQRVRTEAQYALTERAYRELRARGGKGDPAAIESYATLMDTATGGGPPRAVIHAVWGLGHLARYVPRTTGFLRALLELPDPEARAQVARVLGDVPWSDAGFRAEYTWIGKPLIAHLKDDSPRVRFFTAITLGKMASKEALGPLVELLRANDDHDVYLRHAAVVGLAGVGDDSSLIAQLDGASTSVRLGILLALRRRESVEVARFLIGPEPRIVLEAARAIHDLPIEPALPRLAALVASNVTTEAVLRRVVNANVRVGGSVGAGRLVDLARRDDVAESIRVEALDALAAWAKPPGRDRVLGLWRPIPERSTDAAVAAFEPAIATLIDKGPERVRQAGVRTAAALAIANAGRLLSAVVDDRARSTETRVEALKGLEHLHDTGLAEAARRAHKDSDSRLRTEGLRVLAAARPAEAIPALTSVLENGSVRERQGALATLGGMDAPEADTVLDRSLDQLLEGRLAPEVRLDLLEAAGRRPSKDVRDKLARYEATRPAGDPLAAYREVLAGGDVRRGRGVFLEKSEAECVRCHKLFGRGGEVGPDLAGIGARQSREYLLEALVAPSARIAQGFETLVLGMDDGKVVTGILKSEDDISLRLMTPEGEVIDVAKKNVEERARGASAMPDDLVKHLSRSELRDLVEFLASLKSAGPRRPAAPRE
jgi:quinoprotein glucose dehydrogenase